ncbi:MAG: aminotransferase class I/II-fold pyridoxal phosphate-dependent enzyme, partial [Deltaproteobacteria bacterium]|nr:aminotransferase class I/II-fold pyridoxal phosphate-dependent enzyme [Deltaproteobacteria bacterium]
MMEARKKGEDIINLGMGNPDLATPPHIVNKLIEASQKNINHRYSLSRGIPKIRKAAADWYTRRFSVNLNPETEIITTIGAKEGISHLVLSCCSPGDVVFVQSPTYPIHTYSVVIAGADVRAIRADTQEGFLENLERAYKSIWPKPKLLICSFPSNPTTMTVELPFLEKIVAFAKENKIHLIHDIAYADLVFDGYVAPSILQVKGAKDIAVEFFTLSKSYSMPGWRVGFCSGNAQMIAALAKMKSYMDYGSFQPIQIAATVALNGPQSCVKEIAETYRLRRDVLCEGLTKYGWPIEKPKATMFVWAKIPEPFAAMGSLEFAKLLLKEA